jgi:hypothetical protein
MLPFFGIIDSLPMQSLYQAAEISTPFEFKLLTTQCLGYVDIFAVTQRGFYNPYM